MRDSDSPHIISHQKETTPTHFLTHCRWVPEPYFSSGTNETGVRSIKNGKVQDDFHLIQHGWENWELAATIIKRQLVKGRSLHRIQKLMDYMKDRRLIYPKARVA